MKLTEDVKTERNLNENRRSSSCNNALFSQILTKVQSTKINLALFRSTKGLSRCKKKKMKDFSSYVSKLKLIKKSTSFILKLTRDLIKLHK